MADIIPFRAWRYAPSLPYPIDTLLSPLIDVPLERARQDDYRKPYNSIHLSMRGDNHTHTDIAQRIAAWKKERIIAQDPLPGIYVYYQYYTLPGEKLVRCRKGFVAYMRTYDRKEGVVYGHEKTRPDIVADQLDLLAQTSFYSSATHGLYTDRECALEPFMDEAISAPLYEVERDDGVRHALGVIQDKRATDRFVETLSRRHILLADGHHRYRAALEYRHQQAAQAGGDRRGDEGYNFHLAYLSNTVDNDISVLPTHRLIGDIAPWSEEELLQRLGRFFAVTPNADPATLDRQVAQKKQTFGLLLHRNAYLLALKPALADTVDWPLPPQIKRLDTTLSHYFVFEKAMDIPLEAQQKDTAIRFEHRFEKCLRRVRSGRSAMALILPGTPMEEVEKAGRSGFGMPRKSTYFYPKPMVGLLFGSIQKDDFQPLAYPGL